MKFIIRHIFKLRFILTLFMAYMAYQETGIWTALCFLLIFIAIECDVKYFKFIMKRIAGLENWISDMDQP